MTLLEKLQQINRLHELIKRKATGTPKELATRLSISERTVYDCIDIMKSMNAPIYYCRSNKSYCYEYPVDCSFGFRSLDSGGKIYGGCDVNSFYMKTLLQNSCSDSSYIRIDNNIKVHVLLE